MICPAWKENCWGKISLVKGIFMKYQRKSMFDPYYSRIQGLLFEGHSIKEVHEYMIKYFDLYSTYNALWKYIKSRKLDWFMPV